MIGNQNEFVVFSVCYNQYKFKSRHVAAPVFFSCSLLVAIMFFIQALKRTNVVFVAVMAQRVKRSSQLLTRELE